MRTAASPVAVSFSILMGALCACAPSSSNDGDGDGGGGGGGGAQAESQGWAGAGGRGGGGAGGISTLSKTGGTAGSAIDKPKMDAGTSQQQDAAQPDIAAPNDPVEGRKARCPTDGTKCAIMPLGDSITEGMASNPTGGGYRVHLFSLALKARKSITFVGSQKNGPAMVDGQPFPQSHEGHGGYTIEGIEGLVVSAIKANKPHIITLMVGTNDIWQQKDAGAPERFAHLIDLILVQNPNILLVVAQITPFATAEYDARAVLYNASVKSLVNARIAAGKRVLLVDMHKAINDSPIPAKNLSDGIHPYAAGYVLMAEEWFDALKLQLP